MRCLFDKYQQRLEEVIRHSPWPAIAVSQDYLKRIVDATKLLEAHKIPMQLVICGSTAKGKSYERMIADEILYNELSNNTRAIASRFSAEQMTDAVLEHISVDTS